MSAQERLSVVEFKENTPPLAPLTVDFCSLPDGPLVELVFRHGIQKKKLGFLLWNKDNVEVVDYFDHDGFRYMPPVLGGLVSENLNLRLASGVQACAAGAESSVQINRLIHTYIDLSETYASIVTAFIFPLGS